MRRDVASEYINGPEKRALDMFVVGCIGITALAAAAATAGAIVCREKINPLFTQERIGKGGKPFSIFKLRTIRENGEFIAGGEIIRAAGLDETLQFYNIALGHMSVVGYRPLLPEDINHAASRLRAHYLTDSPYHPDRWLELREQCKPGITGPSQTMPVRADAGSLDHLADVIQLESAYTTEASLGTDLRIIATTPYSLKAGHNPTVTRSEAT